VKPTSRPAAAGSSQHWPWPDELDALVAAPKHHALIFENERVRVVVTRIAPGETTAIHTHRWPGMLHIVSWSDMVRRDQNGQVLVDTRKPDSKRPPQVVWSHPLPPHTLENVGTTEIHIFATELKEEPSA
jgi:hypothetical protein